jgi:hypothetical protein
MQKNPDFRFRRCGTSKNTKPMSKKKNTSQNTPKPTPPFTEEMVKARKMVLAGNSFREIADGWLGRTGKPVSRSHIWNIWTAADALESQFNRSPNDCVWKLSTRGRNVVFKLRSSGAIPGDSTGTLKALHGLLTSFQLHPGAIRGYGQKTHLEFIKLTTEFFKPSKE